MLLAHVGWRPRFGDYGIWEDPDGATAHLVKNLDNEEDEWEDVWMSERSERA